MTIAATWYLHLMNTFLVMWGCFFGNFYMLLRLWSPQCYINSISPRRWVKIEKGNVEELWPASLSLLIVFISLFWLDIYFSSYIERVEFSISPWPCSLIFSSLSSSTMSLAHVQRISISFPIQVAAEILPRDTFRWHISFELNIQQRDQWILRLFSIEGSLNCKLNFLRHEVGFFFLNRKRGG